MKLKLEDLLKEEIGDAGEPVGDLRAEIIKRYGVKSIGIIASYLKNNPKPEVIKAAVEVLEEIDKLLNGPKNVASQTTTSVSMSSRAKPFGL